jgi:hypothetical protein
LRNSSASDVYPRKTIIRFPAGAEFLQRSHSPGGNYIAYDFTSSSGNNPPEGIWLSRVDGSAMQLLVRGNLVSLTFNPWLPDGRTISYIRNNILYTLDLK